jgi:hypothetical protein
MKREPPFHPNRQNRSHGQRSSYFSVALFLALLIYSATLSPVSADTEINFHDAVTKFYNDNGFPKLPPKSPLILETTFSVDEKMDVYFNIEESNDNRPYADHDNFKMRITIINDTWSFTDLGEFGDGSDLTAPTNPYTVVPGFNYTVQMKIRFTESFVNTTDTYEFSAVIGVQTGDGFNPSDSISHIVRFSEEPTDLPDITTSTFEAPHFLRIIAIVGVIILAVHFIRHRKKVKKELENDEKES